MDLLYWFLLFLLFNLFFIKVPIIWSSGLFFLLLCRLVGAVIQNDTVTADIVSLYLYVFFFIALIELFIRESFPSWWVSQSLFLIYVRRFSFIVLKKVWHFRKKILFIFWWGVLLRMLYILFFRYQIVWQLYFSFFPDKQAYRFWSDLFPLLIFGFLILIVVSIYFSYYHRLSYIYVLSLGFVVILSIVFSVFEHRTTLWKDMVWIWSVSPKTVTLWDQVTIHGRNFKDLPHNGGVIVDGVEHRVIRWNNEEIIFQAEPGKTKSGAVEVVTVNGLHSNKELIQVYDFFTKEIVK